MALIEINKNPSKNELRWFGLLLLLFFLMVGGLLSWEFESAKLFQILASVGAGLCVVYYVVPPLRKPLYLGWLYAAFPIGWTVSHVILLLTFYLVVTPIGLIMRMVGKDSLKLRMDRSASTYWIQRKPMPPAPSYFKQY